MYYVQQSFEPALNLFFLSVQQCYRHPVLAVIIHPYVQKTYLKYE